MGAMLKGFNMAENKPTPIVIRIYDAAGDFTEFVRLFVPWKILKAAIRLAKLFNNKKIEDFTEDDADSLAALVVEAFGNQFTLDQINAGADISEMLTVIQNIVAKAQGGAPNPTLPGS